ncbi:hypothetical protein B0H17DRAFT_1127061 [Mycena rosella]|uniref:Uncharacterized protein n=1 Tax=Mycena rosella TaxID=1033263 RepID=A0AAD7GS35_MYCRO|nr:hypothetical protein B0H17DRAFT_1127061 [Mycena rosella]
MSEEAWMEQRMTDETARVEKRAVLVEELVIEDKRALAVVTNEVVDVVVMSGEPWKAADPMDLPSISDSTPLYPTRLKRSNNILTHKASKKDKTSPKLYRPVEQHAEALAKPLERLRANRPTFDTESLGILHKDQFGGQPGCNTQQAADAYIHQARSQLDQT